MSSMEVSIKIVAVMMTTEFVSSNQPKARETQASRRMTVAEGTPGFVDRLSEGKIRKLEARKKTIVILLGQGREQVVLMRIRLLE